MQCRQHLKKSFQKNKKLHRCNRKEVEQVDETIVGGIALELGVDDSVFNRDMKNIASDSNNMFKNQFSGLGTKLGVAIGTALTGALVHECLELGSSLSEVQNVVDTTFKDMSSDINSWSKNAITQFGLSEYKAKQYTGTIGAMAKAYGFAGEELETMSVNIAGATGDIASFYNLSTDEAFEKMKSIFTGETESLKSLGIVMSQTALEQYALNNGFGTTLDNMDEQTKAMLRYQFVMDGLSDVHGDFAKTADSWANQTRVMELRIDSLKSSFGQLLIHVLTPAINAFNDLLAELNQCTDALLEFTGIVQGNSTEVIRTQASSAATEIENIGTAAEETEKKLNKLGSYDNLNVISKESDSAGSTTDNTGGTLGGSSVTTTPITPNQAVLTWMDDIKKELEPLTSLGKTFYTEFLKPIGSYILGQGLPRLANITADMYKDINWSKLNESVGGFVGLASDLTILGFENLLNFYDEFLSPLTSWTIGEAFPRLLDIFTDLGEDIDWNKINDALSDIYSVLANAGIDVGEGFISFFEDISDILKPGVVTLVDGIGAGIEFIGDVIEEIREETLELFGSALGGIVSSILMFKTASAVASTIKNISTALGGLNKVLTANPYAVAAAAIGTLIGTLVYATGDEDVVYLSDEIAEIAEATEKLAIKADEAESAVAEFDKELDELSGGTTAGKELEILSDKYYELSQKQDKSAGEMELLKSYSDDLIEKMPELSGLIDEQTGAYKGTKEELDALVEKTKEYYQIQATEDIMKDIVKKMTETELALAEANKVEAEAYNALRDFTSNEDIWYHDHQGNREGIVQKYVEEYNQLADNARNASAVVDDLKSSMEDLNGQYDTCTTYLVDLNKKVDSNSTKTKGLKESVGSVATKYKELPGVIKTVMSTADTNFNTGSSKLLKTAKTEFEKITSTVKTEFGKLPTSAKSAGQSTAWNLGQGINAKKSSATSPAKQLIKDITASLSNNQNLAEFKTLGSNIVEGLISGIEEKVPGLSTTVTKMGKGIASVFADVMDIHSPSGVFEDFGIFSLQGYQGGLEDEEDTTINMLKRLGGVFSTVFADSISQPPPLALAGVSGSYESSYYDKVMAAVDKLSGRAASDDTYEIPVVIDGEVIYRIVKKKAQIKKKQTGNTGLS